MENATHLCLCPSNSDNISIKLEMGKSKGHAIHSIAMGEFLCKLYQVECGIFFRAT